MKMVLIENGFNFCHMAVNSYVVVNYVTMSYFNAQIINIFFEEQLVISSAQDGTSSRVASVFMEQFHESYLLMGTFSLKKEWLLELTYEQVAMLHSWCHSLQE